MRDVRYVCLLLRWEDEMELRDKKHAWTLKKLRNAISGVTVVIVCEANADIYGRL